MTKPFEVKELLFRIKTVLRRYQINAESELKLGNLTLNQSYMELSVDSKTVNLPNKISIDILISIKSKHIFTRDDIIEKFGALIMKVMIELSMYILKGCAKD